AEERFAVGWLGVEIPRRQLEDVLARRIPEDARECRVALQDLAFERRAVEAREVALEEEAVPALGRPQGIVVPAQEPSHAIRDEDGDRDEQARAQEEDPERELPDPPRGLPERCGEAVLQDRQLLVQRADLAQVLAPARLRDPLRFDVVPDPLAELFELLDPR